jgi:hypothetical protein
MVGAIHAIDATGTSGDGTALKLTVTNEHNGKADLMTGTKLFVFNGSGGSLTVTTSSATFSAARLVTIDEASSVTVDGTLTC